MKKIFLSILIILLLAGGFAAWMFFGPSVKTGDKSKEFLYIRTGSDLDDVRKELTEKGFLNSVFWFDQAAKLLKYKNVRAGRYEVTKGMSIVNLVRMLRNGRQTPVNFVITKIRTKEILAGRAGNNFEFDSTAMLNFMSNPDSLKPFGVDTNTVMVIPMPYTYTVNWNTSPGKVFSEWAEAYEKFWTEERTSKASKLGLTPTEVSILASIIDEETNAKSDKPNIASVYRNRIKKGMPLQADPTVKFAMKNFALKRILNVHLQISSPYNTYVNKGLPPGPICTPQVETIDAVLDSPETDYLYFVASSNFDGTHIFTSTYEDHLKYAKLYQQKLNERNIK